MESLSANRKNPKMTNWAYWDYTPGDYYLVEEWAEAHKSPPPHPDWLPETGFILCRPEPLIVCFLYCDPSCRVAFIDQVHTKPRTPISVLKEGITYSMSVPIRQAAAERGIHTILTRSPAAMARIMIHTPGWFIKDKEIMSMVYIYAQEELEVR